MSDHPESLDLVLEPDQVGGGELVERGRSILGLHDRLVLTDTFPLREATPYEVERALLFLARTADLYERTLFGTDAH